MNIIEIGRAITNPNTKDFIQASKSSCEKPMLTTVIKKDMKNDIRSAIKLLNTRLKRLRLILIILIAPIVQIHLSVVSVIFKITILKINGVRSLILLFSFMALNPHTPSAM